MTQSSAHLQYNSNTFICCQSYFFSIQKCCAQQIYTPQHPPTLKDSTYFTYCMLRDLSGHSSTQLVWQWSANRRDLSGFTCWFRWDPGWLSWSLCLTPTQQCRLSIQSDTPPVQLTSQAGSTPCHELIISFSIQVICAWLYTRYVHTEEKRAKQQYSHLKGYTFLMFLLKCFSLCFSAERRY